MTTIAAVLTGHFSQQTVEELITAAGASMATPFQQCQEVANLLESISSLTGVPGFEGASMLISSIASQFVPLLPAEVDPEALFDIFVDHLGEFGKDLNSAIHSGGELPSIPLSLREHKKHLRGNTRCFAGPEDFLSSVRGRR